MQQPKKDPPIPSRGFRYDVDAALAASMQDGTMHEWVLCEGLSAASMVRLFGAARRMCWRVLSTTLQASKYVLFTIMHTTLVDFQIGGELKLFCVGHHVCAMECNTRVQLIHMCRDGLQSQSPTTPHLYACVGMDCNPGVHVTQGRRVATPSREQLFWGFGCNTPFHFFFKVRERRGLATRPNNCVTFGQLARYNQGLGPIL